MREEGMRSFLRYAMGALLLLVTCEGSDENRRVVAARRLREGETAESVSESLKYARKQ